MRSIRPSSEFGESAAVYELAALADVMQRNFYAPGGPQPCDSGPKSAEVRLGSHIVGERGQARRPHLYPVSELPPRFLFAAS